MDHFQAMFKKFQKYREGDNFSDITIVVQNQRFNLHKVVLSAASDYFETLFTVEMKEKHQSEITLNGLTASAFNTCLLYIYTGEIHINLDKVESLLHVSSFLQMWKIKKKCTEEIQFAANKDNCLEFYQFSIKYDCQTIIEDMKNILLCNAENVLTDENLLSKMEFETLNTVLKSDSLNISNECIVYQGLVKWFELHHITDHDLFCQILPFVRMPLISKSFLTGEIASNEHFKCLKCKKFYEFSLKYSSLGENLPLKSYQVSNRVEVVSNILVIDYSCKQIKYFDFKNLNFHDKAKEIDPIHITTKCGAITNYSDILYLIYNRGKSFYCKYKTESTWRDLDTIPVARCSSNGVSGPTIVTYFNSILVIGGMNADLRAIKCVDSLETETQIWSQFPSLNKPRHSSAAVVADENIYVIGGLNTYLTTLASVEMYENGRWKNIPSLNEERYCASAAYYKQKVFVAGGFGKLSSVETYCNGDNAWTMVSELNLGRYLAQMFVYKRALYIFGGCRENGGPLLESWNDENNKWEQNDKVNDNIKACRLLLLP